MNTFRFLRKYLFFPLVLFLFGAFLLILVGAFAPIVLVWGSYLLMVVLLYRFFKSLSLKNYLTACALFAGLLLFGWMRRGEVYWLRTDYTEVTLGWKSRIVIISDIHAGPLKGERYVRYLVNKINTIPSVDAVLIAGDLTYEPKEGTLGRLFAPFRGIRYPTYAVLGNHDSQKPGAAWIASDLATQLPQVGVTLLHNSGTVIGSGIRLFGLGDEWAGQADVSVLSGLIAEEKVVVLTHNPDTAMRYLLPTSIDITFAGHTHGGQIRLPGITQYLIPTVHSRFAKKRYPEQRVFVTRGVGETAVPLRLFDPVTIDVVDIK